MELQNDTYGPALPDTYSSGSPAYAQAPTCNHGPRSSDNYPTSDLEIYSQTPASLSANSIRDQVFGGQLQGQKYTLSHLDDKLHQRRRLHHQHIKDLKHRLSQLQEDLSLARMHAPGPADRDRIKLQGEVNQLEKEKRKEELDYWEDMAEIKQESLETALQYESAKRRAGLFQGMGL